MNQRKEENDDAARVQRMYVHRLEDEPGVLMKIIDRRGASVLWRDAP